MSKLPRGWTEATVEELAGPDGLVSDGDWIESKDQDPEGNVRLIQLADVGVGEFRDRSSRYLTSEKAKELNCTYLNPGDLLIARMPDPIGRACVFPGVKQPAVTAVDVMIWRPDNRLADARWLSNCLNSSEVRAEVEAEAGGTTRQRIAGGRLKRLKIPTPPIAEQGRIVAKIDTLTARSKRARDDLDRIPALVARYKQAILAAAFRGNLTAEWRASFPMPETPAIRIEMLAAERARMDAGRIRSRRGPVSPDDARIPVYLGCLPDEWAVTTLEEATNPARVIQYGILKPGPDIDSGVPYVKVLNIKGGQIELDHIRHTTPKIHAQYKRSSIRKGDILLTIRGTVGRAAFVPDELDGGNITQDSVRIDVLDAIDKRFLFWFLCSPAAQSYFVANQKGVAVRGINVGDVRPMEMPLPTKAEQQEIVRRLEIALALIGRLAKEVTGARKLIERLDQAILSKAFRGELVPQDPNDEPASVLLERIRAERAGGGTGGRRRRSARS